MSDPCFYPWLDDLAKSTGGWPDDVTVHTMEVIGDGDDPQVLLTGSIPIGTRDNGRPKFDRTSRKFKAMVRISEYRAAMSAGTPTPSANDRSC